MKQITRIKKWQLLRVKRAEAELDLNGTEFITVGKRAFRGAHQTGVILPRGVSAIKAEAFVGCKQLERIVLPAENAIGLSYAVFRGCERLQTLENADQISSIGEAAFSGCVSLREIAFGKGLRRIGAEAFRGCNALRSVTLPSSIGTPGKGAFRDCKGLEQVEIDSRVSNLSADLLRGCTALKEIALPEGLLSVPSGLLRNCDALLTLRIPGSARTVGKRAFSGCAHLESVTVELGVERIGAQAFADTPCLREVYVPHTVKKLGFGAFGLGKREDGEKIAIYVNNEYMEKRMKRLLSRCGSAGCTAVVLVGKSIEERKRERRRTSLDGAPAHLIDTSLDSETDGK